MKNAMLKNIAMRSILTVILLAHSMAFAAESSDTAKLPENIQAIVGKAAQDVTKERQKYDAAAKKVTDKLIADLKKEVEKATKAGNLKLGMAIQAQVEEVEGGSVVAKVDADSKDSGVLLGDGVDPAKVIVGKWKSSIYGTVWTFNVNGTFSTTDKGYAGVLEFKKDGSIVATCQKNGNWTNVIRAGVGGTMLGKCDDGKVFTLTRVE